MANALQHQGQFTSQHQVQRWFSLGISIYQYVTPTGYYYPGLAGFPVTKQGTERKERFVVPHTRQQGKIALRLLRDI